MPLKWFDAKASVAFGEEVARSIQSLAPATAKATEKQRSKQLKNIERLLTRVRVFSKQNRLNVYQKAKFANTVRWMLKDAGYPKDFIEAALAMILPVM